LRRIEMAKPTDRNQVAEEGAGENPEEKKEFSVTALLDEMEGEAQDMIPEKEAKALLQDTDLSLPHEFELEILADELLGVLSTFKRATFGRRSARNIGDHQRATQMGQLERYSRLTAALMISEHKGLKAVADEMAEFRAQRAQRERAQALESEE